MSLKSVVSTPRLHPAVRSLLESAYQDFGQVYEKHRSKHRQLRAQVEKRALSGDVEALKQYRQLIRIEQTWKVLKVRALRDLDSLTN
jgi:hypothetical protein